MECARPPQVLSIKTYDFAIEQQITKVVSVMGADKVNSTYITFNTNAGNVVIKNGEAFFEPNDKPTLREVLARGGDNGDFDPPDENTTEAEAEALLDAPASGYMDGLCGADASCSSIIVDGKLADKVRVTFVSLIFRPRISRRPLSRRSSFAAAICIMPRESPSLYVSVPFEP